MAKNKTKEIAKKNKALEEGLLKELENVTKEIEEEEKNVDTINSKIKNISDNIFLGHHDFKMLKLELKNKEIEIQEKKAFSILSSRKVDNTINKYILKCYENFLTTITNDEMERLRLSEALEIQKQKHVADISYEQLTKITDDEHLKKLHFIILSQNKMLEEMNKQFTYSIKEIRKNYSKKINDERENLDKKQRENIFSLQKEKNEAVKNILSDYKENVTNMQNYFKQILEDQMEMIHELEAEQLNKKKDYFEKVKQLEKIKKNLSNEKRNLENLIQEVMLLDKNTEDYNKLKHDLKKIKEKKMKQNKLLEELKFETDVKRMLYKELSFEYEKIYNEQKMKLCTYLQKLLLENYFLEMKMKLKKESLDISTAELNKWTESLNIEENETLNSALNLKFQDFQIRRKKIEDLINKNEKEVKKFEALIHFHYGSQGNLDILKRENDN